MKLNIGEKTVEFNKIGFKALMIYEKVTDESFVPKSLNDIVMLFYSTVFANDSTSSITFDEFVDWLDDNPAALTEFTDMMSNQDKRNAQLEKSDKKKPKKESTGDVKKN